MWVFGAFVLLLDLFFLFIWKFSGIFFSSEVSENLWSCYLLKSVTRREIQAFEKSSFPQQLLSPIPKLRHRLCSHTDCKGRWSMYWSSGETAAPGADVHILSTLFLGMLIKACTGFLTKSSHGWNLSAFNSILAGLRKLIQFHSWKWSDRW